VLWTLLSRRDIDHSIGFGSVYLGVTDMRSILPFIVPHGFDSALPKANFSFVVIRVGKLENGFQLTVYFLANLGRISFGLLRKVDLREGICRVAYLGKFVFQSLEGLAILSVILRIDTL
jgi:hypothetical protein